MYVLEVFKYVLQTQLRTKSLKYVLSEIYSRFWYPLPGSLKTDQLECGPMPNVMAALPNIGGGLCSTLQSLADAHY